MKYYIGIDGGGTKTVFALMGEGKIQEQAELGGTSYRSIGTEAVAGVLAEGLRRLLRRENVRSRDIAGAVLGLPCFGESAAGDAALAGAVQNVFQAIPVKIVNDVVVGWAGALGLAPGINIVAGTGSIAYGKNLLGQSARCGGWDEFFSDEGSCYFLGRRSLELFSKQADGRLPQGALYRIFRRHFSLEDDYELIDRVIPAVSGRREKVAELQMLLKSAADQGDGTAIRAYEEAAHELALLAAGVKQRLGLETGKCPVSYSGGLFKAGAWVLAPLEKELAGLGCQIQAPLLAPWQGAVLLAYREFGDGGGTIQSVIQTITERGV